MFESSSYKNILMACDVISSFKIILSIRMFDSKKALSVRVKYRFILSPGHASMLLYSLLFLSGYELSLDDIKCFRFASKLTEFSHRAN